MPHLLAVPFVLVVAVLLLRAVSKAERRREYVLKPLATTLVIGTCLLSLCRPNAHAMYTWAIALGLLFSLGGDIALLFPSDRAFLLGVASFLLAHVVYALTLGLLGQLAGPVLVPGAALLAIGVAYWAWLYPHLGQMRLPVGVYAVVISIMVWTAISTLGSKAFSATQSWLVAVGAILFYLSDIVLATAKFARPFRGSRLLNLGLYYAGQLCIALSAAYALPS